MVLLAGPVTALEPATTVAETAAVAMAAASMALLGPLLYTTTTKYMLWQ